VGTSELSSLCERLAGEVADELRSGRSKKWRCPGDLRSRIVSYARVCREGGEPLGDIARRLGLVESTLARWLRSDRRALAAGFRSVSIVPATDGGGAAPAGALRLVTPRGYTVEGLDAPTLAFLLRVVG
jgi:transposase-like protein